MHYPYTKAQIVFMHNPDHHQMTGSGYLYILILNIIFFYFGII